MFPANRLACAIALACACVSIAAISSTREEQLIANAGQGGTQAVIDLAEFYQAQGRRADARAALLRSAESGNAIAHRLLAQDLLVDDDGFEAAVSHFERAIALNDRTSLTELGRVLVLRSLDPERPASEAASLAQRAERLLTPYATEANPEAAWLLGYLALHGPASVRDAEAGRYLLRLAADGGQSTAAYLLAREDLPPFDPTADAPVPPAQREAVERGFGRLLQAAEAGHGQAAHELALHFERGVWVTRDLDAAAHWRHQAGSASRPVSVAVADEPPRAGKPAAEHASQADTATADIANTSALHHQIEVLREENERLDRSLREARATILRLEGERDEALVKLAASERDYASLREFRALQVGADELNQSALDLIARQQYVAARPLLEAAARTNHAGAIANLAWYHLHGITVPRDPVTAEQLFVRAAELGNPIAAQNLAQMHALGIGVPVDVAKSESWRRRALAMTSAVPSDLAAR